MRAPLSPFGTARALLGEAPWLEDAVGLRRAEAGAIDTAALCSAHALGALAPSLEGEARRALILLAYFALVDLSEGSTRTAVGDPQALRRRARALGAEISAAAFEGVLARAREEGGPLALLFGAPGAYRPLILEGSQLTLQRLELAERRLAADLRARLRGAEGGGAARSGLDVARVEGAIASVLERPSIGPRGPLRPSEAQVEAMRVALRAPLSVITGGPGTGKTSVVVSILRAYARLRGEAAPSEIALAAPTGKAADRMRASIAQALASVADPAPEDRALEALSPPRTLHRLLAYSARRGRFLRTRESPLPERLVVVDEGSMIDLFMMQRLIAALAPEARLVLLGDADQLPSVAAGAVFRELAEAGQIASARLTESHRMNPDEPAGANILRVAEQLRGGRVPPFAPTAERALPRPGAGAPGPRLEAIRLAEEVGPELLEEEGVGLLPVGAEQGALELLLDRWFERFVLGGPDQRGLAERTWPTHKGAFSELDQERLGRLFAIMERARLLAIRRIGRSPRSVRSLNEALHQRLARHRRASPGARDAPILLPGEPVIVERNDYPRQLWNGDQGIVLRVRSERGVGRRAVFRGGQGRDGEGFVVHDLRGAEEILELGYATTVHKAQGSEHERIALILPEEDLPRLMTREILYTALTRARRGALLVGDPEVLRLGVERRVERSTGLLERLDGGGDDPGDG